MINEFDITLRANINDVTEGINSLLNFFTLVKQPLFPRNIMTGAYSGAFTVNSEKEMYQAFKQAEFHDCRISAYPPVKDDTRLIPNISLLDIDFDESYIKNSDQTMQGYWRSDEVNRLLVSKITERLTDKFQLTNFMIIFTGNGRHILIPFAFTKPFEYVKEFEPYVKMLVSPYRQTSNNILSEQFLIFAKKYLSDDKADKANFPKFTNMYLRVPGTLNWKLKYGMAHVVKLERECNYDQDKTLPNYGDLTFGSDFMIKCTQHISLIAGNQVDQNQRYTPKSQTSIKRIGWIETLHTIAATDCRKRIIRLILAPYAINIRKMSSNDAFVWIKQWAEKCHKAHPFDSGYNVDQQIEYMISKSEEVGYLPISRKRIETDPESWKMRGGITLDEFITNKMDPRNRVSLYP